jgi:hypothetical protein
MKTKRIISAWKTRHLDHEKLQLLDLNPSSDSRLCADMRDKIYAMLGIESTYDDKWLNIDYSLSTADFFSLMPQPTHSWPWKPGSPHLLPPNPEISHPSWVPDWTQYLGETACHDGELREQLCLQSSLCDHLVLSRLRTDRQSHHTRVRHCSRRRHALNQHSSRTINRVLLDHPRHLIDLILYRCTVRMSTD